MNTTCLTYDVHNICKTCANVGHDFEHVQAAMGNSYANEDAEMDFFHKYERNVDFLFIETS